MNRLSTNLRRGLSVAAALALAACATDSVGPDVSQIAPSDAEAQAIGAEVVAETEGIPETFTFGGMLTGMLDFAPARELGEVPQVTPPLGCTTLDPDPPVDTDGDHIPDDLFIVFDCVFTQDAVTFSLMGRVRIQDLSSTSYGVRYTFSDLERRISRLVEGNEKFVYHYLGGVRAKSKSATAFSWTDSTTSVFEATGAEARILDKRWHVDFTADGGAAVEEHRGLPSGTFTVDGSTIRMQGERFRSFAISTVTPLHFDAGCYRRFKFTSGELLIEKTKGDRTWTIQIVFNGCGVEPTVTYTRPGA